MALTDKTPEKKDVVGLIIQSIYHLSESRYVDAERNKLAIALSTFSDTIRKDAPADVSVQVILNRQDKID